VVSMGRTLAGMGYSVECGDVAGYLAPPSCPPVERRPPGVGLRAGFSCFGSQGDLIGQIELSISPVQRSVGWLRSVKKLYISCLLEVLWPLNNITIAN
jgi:hypothetical protein